MAVHRKAYLGFDERLISFDQHHGDCVALIKSSPLGSLLARAGPRFNSRSLIHAIEQAVLAVLHCSYTSFH